MRFTRLVFLLVIFATLMVTPIFACKECADYGGGYDCQNAPPTGLGCHFEVDGCTVPPLPCLTAAPTSWIVASVEIHHQTPDGPLGRDSMTVATASTAIPALTETPSLSPGHENSR